MRCGDYTEKRNTNPELPYDHYSAARLETSAVNNGVCAGLLGDIEADVWGAFWRLVDAQTVAVDEQTKADCTELAMMAKNLAEQIKNLQNKLVQ